MSIADRLTTERPAFTTLAAPRRAGWRPAHDRRNWPDDPEMIPQHVRLFTTTELLTGTRHYGGLTLEGWLLSGGTNRTIAHRTNGAKHPRPPFLDLHVHGSIGQRIKAARVWRSMSQVQLASAVGLDHATISRIESGQRTPSLDALQRIAYELRVPASALLDGGVIA